MFGIKNVTFLSVLFFLAACSVFSNNKDLPLGERIAIIDQLDSENKISDKKSSISVSNAVALSSWRQAQGDPAHLLPNIKAGEGTNKLWEASMKNGASKQNFLISRPVADKNILYAQDTKGIVYAFDLKEGKRIFKTKLLPLNANDSSSNLNGAGLALHGDKLFALTGFGGVFALDGIDGKILWRQDLNVPLRIAPTIAGDKLFVQTIDNYLYALNLSDGSRVWQYNISAEDTVLAGGASSAYHAKSETLIVAFSNGEITAFNSRIGYPVWSNNLVNTQNIGWANSTNAIKSSPVVDGNTVFCAGSNNLTAAIDVETGDILWQKNISSTETPIVNNTTIFLLSTQQNLIALNKNDGQILWETPVLADLKAKKRKNISLSGPILINNQLFVTASNGVVYIFNPENGGLNRKLKLKEDLPFGPISVQEKIIFITDEAHVIVYN